MTQYIGRQNGNKPKYKYEWTLGKTFTVSDLIENSIISEVANQESSNMPKTLKVI